MLKPEEETTELGRRIAELLLAHDWNLERLQQETGVAARQILRARKDGTAAPHLLQKLAKAFDIDVGELRELAGKRAACGVLSCRRNAATFLTQGESVRSPAESRPGVEAAEQYLSAHGCSQKKSKGEVRRLAGSREREVVDCCRP